MSGRESDNEKPKEEDIEWPEEPRKVNEANMPPNDIRSKTFDNSEDKESK